VDHNKSNDLEKLFHFRKNCRLEEMEANQYELRHRGGIYYSRILFAKANALPVAIQGAADWIG
jgi:hypothetical protein